MLSEHPVSGVSAKEYPAATLHAQTSACSVSSFLAKNSSESIGIGVRPGAGRGPHQRRPTPLHPRHIFVPQATTKQCRAAARRLARIGVRIFSIHHQSVGMGAHPRADVSMQIKHAENRHVCGPRQCTGGVRAIRLQRRGRFAWPSRHAAQDKFPSTPAANAGRARCSNSLQ